MNQSIFPFKICDISLPQYQTGSVYFLMSQKDIYHVHIRSTLCLRTILMKYNMGGNASGTDIAMCLRPFVFIANFFFKKGHTNDIIHQRSTD